MSSAPIFRTDQGILYVPKLSGKTGAILTDFLHQLVKCLKEAYPEHLIFFSSKSLSLAIF